MIAEIRRLQSEQFVPLADMAVLVSRRRDAGTIAARLRHHGLALARRELFVAMNRARDHLWLGHLAQSWRGPPR